MTDRKAVYILSTHWDREFYQTQEGFRYRLVEIIDNILDGFASGTLKGPFYSDGQVELWDQYLEIRPERSDEVRQLMAAGKIEAGPWYTMPDLFCVSGEALVRNLEYGMDRTRELGGVPSVVANACDCFGHPGQLPQIYTQFGMAMATIWRGTNHKDHRNLLWSGPDGSEIACYRFGRNSYWGYGVHVRNVNKFDVKYTPERFHEDLSNWITFEAERTSTSQTLLFDGIDHAAWDQGNYQQLSKVLGKEVSGHTVEHSSFDAYAQKLVSESKGIDLSITGEQRYPGFKADDIDDQKVLQGVLSSRIRLKQLNAINDATLRFWAEPFTAFESFLFGSRSAVGFLKQAWKHSLITHFHDSISGSVPHSSLYDNEYRLRQSTEIAEELTKGAQSKIAANVSTQLAEGEARLVVFNSLPQAIEKTIEITIDLPTEWQKEGSDTPPPFDLIDDAGKVLSYTLVNGAGEVAKTRTYPDKEPLRRKADQVVLAANLSLPAIGYRSYEVRHRGPAPKNPQSIAGIATECALENEYLKVTVEDNGTLTVIDKEFNETYTQLLTFADEADKGHVYHCDIPADDRPFTSLDCLQSCEVNHSGKESGRLDLHYRLNLPSYYNRAGEKRSQEIKPFDIQCSVSLKQGRRSLDVKVEFENTIHDHRLRLLCPTAAKTDSYFTDAAFDAIERSVDPHPRYDELCEPWTGDSPQWHWIAAQAESRGLAYLSNGLLESKLMNDEQRTLAITLLRSARNFFWEYDKTNDYDQGFYSIDLRIHFLGKKLDPAKLFDLGQEVAAPPRAVLCEDVDQRRWRSQPQLPTSNSLLQIDGTVVVTSCKQVPEGLELRLFNPAQSHADFTIRLGDAISFSTIQERNLDRSPVASQQAISHSTWRGQAGPKKILTLLLSDRCLKI